jgi:hypothetical protein
MNIIPIFAPRWHDRKLLIAKWRVGTHNQINIAHTSFKEPLYMSGEKLRAYPLEKKQSKNQSMFEVYAVPISDFMTLSEHNEILDKAKEAFNASI